MNWFFGFTCLWVILYGVAFVYNPSINSGCNLAWIQNQEAMHGYGTLTDKKPPEAISCRTRFPQGCREYKELEERAQKQRIANDALTRDMSFDDKNAMRVGGTKDATFFALVPGFGPHRRSISVCRPPGAFPAVGMWSDKPFPSSSSLLFEPLW